VPPCEDVVDIGALLKQNLNQLVDLFKITLFGSSDFRKTKKAMSSILTSPQYDTITTAYMAVTFNSQRDLERALLTYLNFSEYQKQTTSAACSGKDKVDARTLEIMMSEWSSLNWKKKWALLGSKGGHKSEDCADKFTHSEASLTF
jgi:hypothetical protein